MHRKTAVLAVLAALAVGGVRAEGVAIGARVSTLGFGGDLVFGLSDRVNARLGGNRGSVSYEDNVSDVNYDIDLELQSYSLLLDWHPGGGAFRLTGGGVYNATTLEGLAQPTDEQDIGDHTYTPQQIGTLQAEVDFPDWAGYVGIGFGNPVKTGRWTATLDLGVMLHAKPDFTLESDSPYSAMFEEDLEKERQEIQDDYVDKFTLYPVLSLGLAYRF